MLFNIIKLIERGDRTWDVMRICIDVLLQVIMVMRVVEEKNVARGNFGTIVANGTNQRYHNE